MAPVAVKFSDLAFSSLELDAFATDKKQRDLSDYLKSLTLDERNALTNELDSTHSYPKRSDDDSILSPMKTYNMLSARSKTLPSSTVSINPASGGVDPNDINMKGIQAIFALIGASFVLGAIWFFFWAKNGGFQWRKGDWEEYKSTVLRRKGPNGTTLSNATKSTKLGGGSVVGQGYSDEGSTVDGTFTATASDLSSEAPIMSEKVRSKKKTSKRQTAKEDKMRAVKEEKWEGGHDNDVRAYRHEKAARVGGLNTASDAQFYGTDYTASNASDMYSNAQRNAPRQSSRQASPDKRQTRRDFSYGNDAGFNATMPNPSPTRPSRYHSPPKNADRRSMPGSYTDAMDFDKQSQNTKSYHHPISGLGGGRTGGGYRRDRRDSLDD